MVTCAKVLLEGVMACVRARACAKVCGGGPVVVSGSDVVCLQQQEPNLQ